MLARWLQRLAMSMVILGLVLVWEGYRIQTGQNPAHPGLAWLSYAGGAILLAGGAYALRQRYQRRE